MWKHLSALSVRPVDSSWWRHQWWRNQAIQMWSNTIPYHKCNPMQCNVQHKRTDLRTYGHARCLDSLIWLTININIRPTYQNVVSVEEADIVGREVGEYPGWDVEVSSVLSGVGEENIVADLPPLSTRRAASTLQLVCLTRNVHNWKVLNTNRAVDQNDTELNTVGWIIQTSNLVELRLGSRRAGQWRQTESRVLGGLGRWVLGGRSFGWVPCPTPPFSLSAKETKQVTYQVISRTNILKLKPKDHLWGQLERRGFWKGLNTQPLKPVECD